MKVYLIVDASDYYATETLGAFSTEELAEENLKRCKHKGDCHIEEYTLDQFSLYALQHYVIK